MTTHNLFGLKVKLQGADVCRRCGYPVAIIRPPKGMYAATLQCCACSAPCDALSEQTASFIQSVAKLFGAPAAITLRRGSVLAPSPDLHRSADNSPACPALPRTIQQ